MHQHFDIKDAFGFSSTILLVMQLSSASLGKDIYLFNIITVAAIAKLMPYTYQ